MPSFVRRMARKFSFAAMAAISCAAQSNSNGVGAVLRDFLPALAGSWSSGGEFADGRAIASRITFAGQLAAQAVRFEHQDRAPSKFALEVLRRPVAKSNQVVPTGLAETTESLQTALRTA